MAEAPDIPIDVHPALYDRVAKNLMAWAEYFGPIEQPEIEVDTLIANMQEFTATDVEFDRTTMAASIYAAGQAFAAMYAEHSIGCWAPVAFIPFMFDHMAIAILESVDAES